MLEVFDVLVKNIIWSKGFQPNSFWNTEALPQQMLYNKWDQKERAV